MTDRQAGQGQDIWIGLIWSKVVGRERNNEREKQRKNERGRKRRKGKR